MSQSSNDASVPEEKTEPTSQNSQESDDITKPMRNLDVDSPKKNSRKRGRPKGTESPAKLSRSASATSLGSGMGNGMRNGIRRGRGRPKGRMSDIGTKLAAEPPVKPIVLADLPTGGVLMAFGMGDAGQLGMGEDIMERKKPQLVKEIDDDVVGCAAGGMHNVFITKKGEVFTFGCNDEGALGRKAEEEEDCFLPAKVEGVGVAVYCCAGDSHSAVINDVGEVWVWGTFRDANGRLGVGTGNDQNAQVEKSVLLEPAKLHLPEKALRIASGADHMLILDYKGDVWSLGCAESGQLGRVAAQFCTKGGRRGAGKVLNPEKVALRSVTRKTGKVTGVACGQFCSFLLTETGKVIGFGLNNCHQLGFDDKEIRYNPQIIPMEMSGKDISSGMHHTVLLSEKGEVFTIGCGDYGRLGVGEKDKLRESDSFRKVALPGKAIKVASGSCTTYATLEDGSTYAWGMGTNLQLTNGSEEDEWEPIPVSGKQLEGKQIETIDGGGQHVILLVTKKED